MFGILSLIATPIGNLEDITYRAVRLLGEADLILCEDTRVTSKLLAHLKIQKSLQSLHEHSRGGVIERCLEQLKQGKNIAYVSDAGTPGVNDPGGKLVEAAYEAGVRVQPIPGASALTAAISVCGFPMDDFLYLGFAPHKKGRETFFREMAERELPTIFFESTHRVEKALDGMAKYLDPTRLIFCGRELTKMYETVYRGTVEEVRQSLKTTSLKGEFVFIIGPKS